MGLELPGWLTEPLGWIGLTWPEADEEKLFEDGQRWISFGTTLSSIQENADASAKPVWSTGNTTDDAAVNAFREWWTNEDGPSRRLSDDAVAAEIIGAALIVFAGITLAMKIAFIVQLITLAIEVAQAIATAFVSFGATTAEVPGFIAATRVFCRQLIKQVVDHITTVIKDLLERAKNLFKKLATKDGRKALEHNPLVPKKLDPRFRGENDPLNPNRFFNPSTVHYMDAAEREQYRLVVRDGKLVRASDGTPFDTAAGSTLHQTGGRGRAMYVMDMDGNMYASNTQIRGVLHHSSFLSGGDVAGAGEIDVTDGVLNVMSRKSGHYVPEVIHQNQVMGVLTGQGVDPTNVILEAGF